MVYVIQLIWGYIKFKETKQTPMYKIVPAANKIQLRGK